MAIALIDDQLVARVLTGRPVRGLGRYDVATTGLWYLRLCQAVDRANGGRLSGPLLALPDDLQAVAYQRLVELPHDIQLMSLRMLVPVMARQQRDQPKLNLLGREVLAAATSLPAVVLTAVGNVGPKLAAALAAHGVRCRAVET